MKKITVPFFISHQGCPHTCSFCDQKTISGEAGVLPTSSEMIQKINEWHVSAHGRPLEVAFFGGTFTALPRLLQERLLHPLQVLVERGTLAGIRISTRPDYLDSETVAWLKQYGVSCIEIGAQSMDNDVLQRAERGHTAESVLKALKAVRQHGISAGVQLMPGLPGDTLETSRYSLRQVIEGGAQFLRLYPVVVLEGTVLAGQFAEGTYQSLMLAEGVQWCKVLLHDAIVAAMPVIRIGLQADEGLNRQTIIAGCWHPAFGQLVSSALYADLTQKLLESIPAEESCKLFCHPSRLSDCIGQNREHKLRFKQRIVSMQTDSTLKKEHVRLENIHQNITGSIVKDLFY